LGILFSAFCLHHKPWREIYLYILLRGNVFRSIIFSAGSFRNTTQGIFLSAHLILTCLDPPEDRTRGIFFSAFNGLQAIRYIPLRRGEEYTLSMPVRNSNRYVSGYKLLRPYPPTGGIFFSAVIKRKKRRK
jgi:hypothetical protein